MESVSETAMSTTASKASVEQEASATLTASKIVKQATMSAERQVEVSSVSSGGSSGATKTIAALVADDSLGCSDSRLAMLLDAETDAEVSKQHSQLSTTSSILSKSSVMKKSSSTVVAETSSTTVTSNGVATASEPEVVAAVVPKQKEKVTIEDCSEAADASVTAVVIVSPKADTVAEAVVVVAAEHEAADKDASEEVVTETVKVVKSSAPEGGSDGTTTTTTTTVTVLKKQSSSDAGATNNNTSSSSANSSRRSSCVTTTTTTASTVAEKEVPATATAALTAAAAAVVEAKPSAAAAAPVEQKQQAEAEEVEEEEEEEEEEDEEEEEEEEEVVAAAEDGDKEKKVASQVEPAEGSTAQTVTVTAAAPTPVPVPAVAAAPAISEAVPQQKQQQLPPQPQPQPNKQDTLSHTLKEIISDIDSNIQEQESIAILKLQQQQLLQKQQELAQQIRQQQLIAQQLAAENHLHQQQLQQQQQQQQQQLQQQQQPQLQQQQQQQPQLQQQQQQQPQLQQQQSQRPYQPPLQSKPPQQQQQQQLQPQPQPKIYEPQQNVSKYSTYEETQDEHGFTRKSETYESEESSNVSKRIDLHKIFTPATDAEEILPKNRKLYASSAFYSPTLHPTVEDQVELARRISHSLSDISNQKSKGQSMYVNRKKRSVKWVHEGCGQDKASSTQEQHACEEEWKENSDTLNDTAIATETTASSGTFDKVPLRLLMNPRGQMRDINSLRDSLNTETGLLSPDKCAELVLALQTQKGRGAELFAKRRRKAEKWVVDETNAGTQSPSGLPDYHQYQPKPPTSPSIVPAYSDAGKHRVQLNMHQEQLLEKYAKPGLKVVKTPWEAALETGSASAAFVEESKLSPHHTPTPALSPAPQYHDMKRCVSPYGGPAPTVTDSSFSDSYTAYAPAPQQHKLPQFPTSKPGSIGGNYLAYKPNLPQGWKAPSMSLPKEREQHNHRQQLELQQRAELQMQQEQQERLLQQQHITEAVQSCDISHCKDEDEEIISFSGRLACLAPPNTSVAHEFADHLIRSPELRVSPIPPQNLLLYDSAVQELQKQQQQHQQQQQQQHQPPTCATIEERQKRVNVRKQLQEIEQYQQQLRQQQRQEELLLRQREERQKQQQRKQQQGQAAKPPAAAAKEEAKQQPQQEHAEEQAAQEEEALEYVKVAVRDLILNFEQQTLAEAEELAREQHLRLQLQRQHQKSERKQQQQQHLREQQQQHATFQPLNDMRGDAGAVWPVDSEQEVESDADVAPYLQSPQTPAEELYMPKEIPLESYAPPPSVNISNKPISYESSSTWQPSAAPVTAGGLAYPYSAPKFAAPSSTSTGFPLSKPSSGGFSSPVCAYGTATPPKQQYWAPTSYQTVPQPTSQSVPPVNFNPSPLPYDKLAKFEGAGSQEAPPSTGYSCSPQPRQSRLGAQGHGSAVCNISPKPYGVSSAGRPSRYSPAASSGGAGGNYGYELQPAQRPPSQQYSNYSNDSYEQAATPISTRFSSDELLQSQNFNNSARGWRAGATASAPCADAYSGAAYRPQPKPMVAVSNLPYTDF